MKTEKETGDVATGTGSNEPRIRLAIPDDAAIISKVLLEAFLQFRNLYTQKAFAALVSAKLVKLMIAFMVRQVLKWRNGLGNIEIR
ncbi:MAG: hypothetical protein ABR502_05540 [Chitinophagaceae bacterium]